MSPADCRLEASAIAARATARRSLYVVSALRFATSSRSRRSAEVFFSCATSASESSTSRRTRSISPPFTGPWASALGVRSAWSDIASTPRIVEGQDKCTLPSTQWAFPHADDVDAGTEASCQLRARRYCWRSCPARPALNGRAADRAVRRCVALASHGGAESEPARRRTAPLLARSDSAAAWSGTIAARRKRSRLSLSACCCLAWKAAVRQPCDPAARCPRAGEWRFATCSQMTWSRSRHRLLTTLSNRRSGTTLTTVVGLLGRIAVLGLPPARRDLHLGPIAASPCSPRLFCETVSSGNQGHLSCQRTSPGSRTSTSGGLASSSSNRSRKAVRCGSTRWASNPARSR